jgi:hypothetical protein
LLLILGPYIKNTKKEKKEKIQKIKKCWKKIKTIYKWYTRTPRKLSKTDWERSKYIKLENLTVYFWLLKALFARKNQFEEENSKLNV